MIPKLRILKHVHARLPQSAQLQRTGAFRRLALSDRDQRVQDLRDATAPTGLAIYAGDDGDRAGGCARHGAGKASDVGDQIESALAMLPAEQREAFLLKHVEELTYDEMSAMTGVSVPALKMRVKRACDGLRTMLEGVYHG